MYAWIWRHIPFQRWQLKLLVSLVLVAGVGSLLWYKGFPIAERVLPFEDGQIQDSNGAPVAGDSDVGPSAGPSQLSGQDNVPYPTTPISPSR